jgi:hypothetical protein
MSARAVACDRFRRMVRTAVFLAVWSGSYSVGVSTATAQAPSEIRLELGAAQVQQFARDTRNAALFSILWRESDVHFATLFSAAATYTRDSLSAMQGVGELFWRPNSDSRFFTEIGAALANYGVTTLGRGGNFSGWLRQRIAIGDGGLFAGGSLAQTKRDDFDAHATAVEAGGWYRINSNITASGSLARRRTDDSPLMYASGTFLTRVANTYDLMDANLSARIESGRFSLDAAQSWRSGAGATLVNQSAFFWTAGWELNQRFAVAVSGGRQLSDPSRGAPDVNLYSASLRYALRTVSADVVGTSITSSARLLPTPDGTLLTVLVNAPDSVIVEIAGSFSGWDPVPMTKTPTGWQMHVILQPGRYRVAIRYDGGAWRAPGNLGRVKDDFDGESGLLIVP